MHTVPPRGYKGAHPAPSFPPPPADPLTSSGSCFRASFQDLFPSRQKSSWILMAGDHFPNATTSRMRPPTVCNHLPCAITSRNHLPCSITSRVCDHLSYATTSRKRPPSVWDHLPYATTSLMRSPPVCDHLLYATTSRMRPPTVCDHLPYATNYRVGPPPVCDHLPCATTSRLKFNLARDWQTEHAKPMLV